MAPSLVPARRPSSLSRLERRLRHGTHLVAPGSAAATGGPAGDRAPQCPCRDVGLRPSRPRRGSTDSLAGGHLPLGPGQRLDLHVLGAGGVPSSGVGFGGSHRHPPAGRASTSMRCRSGRPAPTSPASSTMTVDSVRPGQPSPSPRSAARGWCACGTRRVSPRIAGRRRRYYPTSGTASGQRLHLVRPFRLYDSRAADIMRSGTRPDDHLAHEQRHRLLAIGAAIVERSGVVGDRCRRPGRARSRLGSGRRGHADLLAKTTKASSRTVTSLSAAHCG